MKRNQLSAYALLICLAYMAGSKRESRPNIWCEMTLADIVVNEPLDDKWVDAPQDLPDN